MATRIGVYVCECGPNIKTALDTGKLVEYAGILDGVILARPHGLLCSAEGLDALVRDIGTHSLDRVVVAGCSPREHESTFRKALTRAGLNPYLLQMANIREQCAWVTPDRNDATEKAKHLLRAAVLRVVRHAPLAQEEIDCRPDVLVVGAGVAGINAALTLAQAHRKVYLVEKAPCIGGHAALYEDLAPELECAACLLTPQMDAVRHHDHIEVLTCSEVVGVVGDLGHFTVQVRKRARLIDATACLGCRECLDDCPVAVPNEYNEGLDRRGAVHIPYEGALPNVALIDRINCLRFTGGDCTACRDACPFDAVDYGQQDEFASLDVGAIILATGFGLFDPARVPRYGYGDPGEVYSALAFERLLNQNGPTEGQIRLKKGKPPRIIAFIHCVGSRSRDGHAHCSGVCCAYLLKFALQTQKQSPDITIHQFYTDLCLPGRGGQALLDRARRLPRFVRHRLARPEAITVGAAGDALAVDYTDAGGARATVTVDMVVLGPAMTGRADAGFLGDLLGIERDADGFWVPAHPQLAPVATHRDGVFVAGCGQGPRDVAASVAQGQAAAGRVLQQLIPGRKLPLDPTAASIDGDICAGCKTCLGGCEFGAVTYDETRQFSTVNPALCQGCGMCAAVCPSGAVTAAHDTDETIGAEIKGLLGDSPRMGEP